MTGRLITDYSSPAEVVGGANLEFRATDEFATSFRVAQSRSRSTSVSCLGAFAAFGAAVLCLAFSPQVSSDTFTPKFAILLLFAAAGVVPLASLVRAKTPVRWPARAAVLFLVVAFVSALMSPSPNIGFFGLYLWGTGWLFWLGAAGAFAIGASLSGDDRRWLLGGILVGTFGNALIAIFQVVVKPPGALALYDGTQADGVLGNPIYLEALLLGAIALLLGRVCRNPVRWGAGVVLLAVGVELTSERLAPIILIALIVYALYSYGLRRGGVFAGLTVGGYGFAYLVGGSGLGSRVASGTSDTTYGTRLRIWLEGARYVAHHPFLGAGPGGFRTAMDSVASLSFVQQVLAGRILTDGHDIFVEVAVTTGLLGLIFFSLWLFGAARLAARCGLLGFAATMIAVEFVEPVDIAIVPLALLALGAAIGIRLEDAKKASATVSELASEIPVLSATSAKRHKTPPYARIVTAVAVCAALFLGVTMVVGDAYMFRGTNSAVGTPFNLAAATDANRLLPYWPDPALEVAQIDAFDSTTRTSGGPVALLDSRRWMAIAVNRDSTNPRLWTLLATAELELGKWGRARADYYRALSCDKWYTQAFQGLGQLATARGQWKEAVRWYEEALATAVHYPADKVGLEGLLKGAEVKARSVRS